MLKLTNLRILPKARIWTLGAKLGLVVHIPPDIIVEKGGEKLSYLSPRWGFEVGRGGWKGCVWAGLDMVREALALILGFCWETGTVSWEVRYR